jgi:hypothetical protein
MEVKRQDFGTEIGHDAGAAEDAFIREDLRYRQSLEAGQGHDAVGAGCVGVFLDESVCWLGAPAASSVTLSTAHTAKDLFSRLNKQPSHPITLNLPHLTPRKAHETDEEERRFNEWFIRTSHQRQRVNMFDL